MLKIGDFSKLSGISIRMLRHYDETGLLIPAEVDHFTSYRYYHEDQLTVAYRITSLKRMGFSQAVIGELLTNYDDRDELIRFLTIKKQELTEQSDEMKYRMMLLDSAMERLRKDEENMKYDVNFKVLPERYVASVRDIIPSYDQEGILWNTLMRETAGLNIQDATPCYTLALFHDGEYKEHDVDVEVQKSVKGSYANTEHVEFKMAPAVEMASAVYKGSYEKITEVNEAVANWVRDNGYEFNGWSFCIYHISPHETQNPEELVTEVCYPVKKKA